jgi:DNA polymerase
MTKGVPSSPAVPHGSLRQLREQAAHCTACPLYKNATQTVFGEGLQKADVVLVGEQPGDQEDLAGRPFVGPAGKLLDRALADAGIDRRRVYVTNAVKHFKWTPRGKRRLHQKPDSREIMACQPWLLAELAAIRPRLVICLGATAVRSLLGTAVRVMRDRGQPLTSPRAPHVFVTVHPSALLRAPDEASREEGYRLFVADLRAALKAAGPL